jgi:hypothetical protein
MHPMSAGFARLARTRLDDSIMTTDDRTSRWRDVVRKSLALLGVPDVGREPSANLQKVGGDDRSANLPTDGGGQSLSFENFAEADDGMRPALHFHLHVHLGGSAPATRRTQRLTDHPAYVRASDEGLKRYHRDLLAMARAADDAHSKSALTRLAERAQREIDDALDAANLIHDSFKLAVERATVRKIGQMRRLSSER